MSTITSAINAYQSAAKTAASSASVQTEDQVPAGQSFSDLLHSTTLQAVEAGKQSEQVSKQALAGKADLRDVVVAVQNAEVTLETVVAVRDKVVNAYNEILKMPI